MKFISLLLVIFTFISSVYAEEVENEYLYNDFINSKEVAKRLLENSKSISLNPKEYIPSYEEDFNIDDSVLSQSPKLTEEAKYIYDTSQTRARFNDINKGELANQSKKILENNEQNFIEDHYVSLETQDTKDEKEYICEEAGKQKEIKCNKVISTFDIEYKPAKKDVIEHWTCCNLRCRTEDGVDHNPEWRTHEKNGALIGEDNPYCPPCARCPKPPTVIIREPEQFNLIKEETSNYCEAIENNSLRNCVKKSESCLDDIPRNFYGREFNRCWNKEFNYTCTPKSNNNCNTYKNNNCQQVGSQCIQKEDNICINWKQTYRCKVPSSKIKSENVGDDKKKIFCLNGNCADTSFDSNKEFESTLAQLSVLSEIQNNNQHKVDSLFAGEDNVCRKSGWGFSDCCKEKGKGWGHDIKITECSTNEMKLAKKVDQGLCVVIGTYTAESNLIGMKKKNRRYCCFTSKLGRILNEQARPQLGLNFGTPAHPICRGFTVDELQSIDFSKLDFIEIYEDIRSKFKPVNYDQLHKTIQNGLDNLKEDISNKLKENSIKKEGNNE
ncbi:MAG: conjugal transfer protein TraN [Sphingobacteriia bacterium]|nr:conjugal transfer protein TraN [Sphingobacteriia bacterium]